MDEPSGTPLEKMTVEELAAKRAQLLDDRAKLQLQIDALWHRQAAIDNDLTILGLLSGKAKKAE